MNKKASNPPAPHICKKPTPPPAPPPAPPRSGMTYAGVWDWDKSYVFVKRLRTARFANSNEKTSLMMQAADRIEQLEAKLEARGSYAQKKELEVKELEAKIDQLEAEARGEIW